MKKTLLITLLLFGSIAMKAETFTVEVGGNQNITPYYEPQFLTINVGDTIIWDFVLGQHNVTTTSGPESIDSGDLTSPNTFMHVFTIAGTYDYECTLFNHADTQFGTITVNSPDGIEDSELVNVSIYPNPATDFIKIETDAGNVVTDIRLVNSNGAELSNIDWNKDNGTIDLTGISNGIYIVTISSAKGVIRKSIKVER